MANVGDVLTIKGTQVHTIRPTATVLEATHLMNHHKIGALVVTTDDASLGSTGCDRVVGMFTERDVLTRLVTQQKDPATTLVEEIMTADVAFCRTDTSLDDVSAMMRERRIRHLPVCASDGRLRGLISIGDLNAWHAKGQEVEIMYLHDYIYGRV